MTLASTKHLINASTSALSGTWQGSMGETYKIEPRGKGSWTCVQGGIGAQKYFSVAYDRDSNLIWWGTKGAFFLDPSEVCQEPERVKWYAAGDVDKRIPKFTWYRADEVSSKEVSGNAQQRRQAKGRSNNAGLRWCVKTNS